MSTPIADRARAYRSRYEQFGLLYTALAPMRSLAEMAGRRLSETSELIEGQLLKIEGAQGILGPAHRAYTGHSSDENRAVFTAWEFAQGGDEWNDSDEPERWKATLIDEVLLAGLGDAESVLEIGPGAGRWSEVLQPRAKRLVLVDVTPRALELTRERLGDVANVEFILSDGGTFAAVEASSVDFVWSFDAFVHIAPLDVASYVSEVARVVRPGGSAVIHHSGAWRRSLGWRSPMTAVLFAQLAREQGLEVERQFDSWSNGHFGVRAIDDVITALRLPDG